MNHSSIQKSPLYSLRRSLMALLAMLAIITSFLSTSKAQNPGDAIVGEWLSAKKDSRIILYREGKTYSGKITWGTGGSARDEKNPNPALRNRNVIGLVILNGFAYENTGTWGNGSIYDPREGKTYSCKMTLKTPNLLNIRGYVGLSLFGRTEVWSRVN